MVWFDSVDAFVAVVAVVVSGLCSALLLLVVLSRFINFFLHFCLRRARALRRALFLARIDSGVSGDTGVGCGV